MGGCDLGLAKRATSLAAAPKPSKKTPVDRFQDSRAAESTRVQEKMRMQHEEKMARLSNKKLKYELSHKAAADDRASQLEMLRLRIELAKAQGPSSFNNPMTAISTTGHPVLGTNARLMNRVQDISEFDSPISCSTSWGLSSPMTHSPSTPQNYAGYIPSSDDYSGDQPSDSSAPSQYFAHEPSSSNLALSRYATQRYPGFELGSSHDGSPSHAQASLDLEGLGAPFQGIQAPRT